MVLLNSSVGNRRNLRSIRSLVSPLDAISDLIPMLGFTDDAGEKEWTDIHLQRGNAGR
ncbi:DUF1232 domain-containing protein [Paenibacillus peoriae]|uniref:DUF1232 domain-containing protein n=1 Tax=Paenibacillus peoriae TaxID=59893 RepID=UPI003F9CBB5F